jgi:hypothetical protein
VGLCSADVGLNCKILVVRAGVWSCRDDVVCQNLLVVTVNRVSWISRVGRVSRSSRVRRVKYEYYYSI